MKEYKLTKAVVEGCQKLPISKIYQRIQNDIQHINPDEMIKIKLSNNIEGMMAWLPDEKHTFDDSNLYQRIAKQSLVNTLLILKVIRYFKENMKEDINEVFKGGHVVIEDGGALYRSLESSMTTVKRYSSHYKEEKIAAYKKTSDYRNGQINDGQLEAMFNTSTPDNSIQAGFIFHEAVFGHFFRDGKTYSWFQLEAHSHQAVEAYGNKCLDLIDGLIKGASHELGQFMKKGNQWDYSLEKFLHHCDFVKYTFFRRRVNIGPYGNSPRNDAHPMMVVKPR